MSYPVSLTVINKENDQSYEITAEFDERAWRLLNDYLRYAEELSEIKLLKSRSLSRFELSWSSEQGLEIVGGLPPWDDVIVFLHKLRPLILESESASFKNVSSILGKHLADDFIRRILKEAKQTYHLHKLQSLFTITIGKDVILNSEKALNTWLNADEYHRAEDLREQLDSITQVVSYDGARAIFLMLLTERMKAIFTIAHLVSSVVGKKPKANFQIEIER